MKIILFGGSFDPIHNGHIQIALNALKEMKADKVIFIPNNKSKNKTVIVNENHRLQMLKIALKDYKEFDISEYELLNNDKVSYTIDTINYFIDKYNQDSLFFLLGADQFNNIHEWKSYEELLKKIKFLIYPRNNIDIINKYQAIIMNGKEYNISSTNIRNNNLWSDVPIEVNKYINDHGLYCLERYKLFNISEKRLQHSMRVAQLCRNIMSKHNQELVDYAWSAGIYHDVCKCECEEWLEKKAYQQYGLKKAISWKVLHGPVAAMYLVEKLKFDNELILNAIRRHTLPLNECRYENLTLLDKILYCADKLEINRTEDDIKNINYYRELLNKNVDQCFNELIDYFKKEY